MSYRRTNPPYHHHPAPVPAPAPAPAPAPPPSPVQQHTLVLLQGSSKASSKQYSDYESVAEAMDGICSLYEYQLTSVSSSAQQQQTSIHYDISELFAFIDRLHDLAVLVYSPQLRAYEPHDKHWIKATVYEHLKQQAGGG